MASQLSRALLRELARPSSSKISRFSLNLSSQSFCSSHDPEPASDSDIDNSFSPSPDSFSSDPIQKRPLPDMKLENGWDAGVYKAILIGEVGHTPMQKNLASGRTVTTLSLGTGGVRNNRRPLETEEPVDFANKSAVQWHRVSFYQERIGQVVLKHATPGKMLYVEGNLETKMFVDPVTGVLRRLREIAVRRNGRVLFLGNVENEEAADEAEEATF